jgi:hypothetical protein
VLISKWVMDAITNNPDKDQGCVTKNSRKLFLVNMNNYKIVSRLH